MYNTCCYNKDILNLFSGRAANHGNVEALIMLAVAHLYSEGGKMHVICYDNP